MHVPGLIAYLTEKSQTIYLIEGQRFPTENAAPLQ